jgi:uncharacterized protein YneF (UPF0154 family)
MRTFSRFTIVLVIASVLVAGTVGGTALASTHGSAAKAKKNPPCTKVALQAGLKRGPAAKSHVRFTKPFGCARRWAYSGGLVGHGQAEFEVTVLYHAVNGRWQSSSRIGPCKAHTVPKKIYKPACETN